MRLILIRHGNPDYVHDCLTELGKLQASAVAKRLESEQIEQVYASTCGRAMETAAAFAAPHGFDILPLEFMREIGWGSRSGKEIFAHGHPWAISDQMAQNGFGFWETDWRSYPDFADNIVTDTAKLVAENTDIWLATLGYERVNNAYLCHASAQNGSVALFSHAGSSTAMLSHLLQLPFAYCCHTLPLELTSVTILNFPYLPNKLVLPKIELANDARHLQAIIHD